MFDAAVLDGLNEQQRAAATHTGGPLRVLAGPGTGKTTTLTARVAWLVASGVQAERVLLLTFTRRAARQMLARTELLLAGSRAQTASGRVRGGTFHAVAHQVLRRGAARLGLPEGFGVVDAADAADLVDLVRSELGLGSTAARRFPRKATLLDVYSRAVNTSRPLSAVLAESAPWASDRLDEVAAVCRGYVARKRALGLLDFDDLLLHWRAAVLDDRTGAGLRDAFDHVLVDEYQDVNALQVDVLRALRARDERLTVVGDDAQAVYGFRGADARHIIDFPAVFAGSATVVLERNYRSAQPVLDLANAVAAQAPEGFTAVLRAAPGAPAGDGAPVLWRCRDEDEQSRAVCEQVLALREEGVPLKEQAVLMRAAHHSAALELELSLRRIPFVKYGGLRFLEAAHVKDLLAAYRLADNPRDELAWHRLLQLLPGVGPAAARRAVAALGVADERSGPAGEVGLRWPLAAQELPEPARPLASALVAALERLPLEAVATHAERLRAAVAPLVAQAYPEPAARLADLDAVVAAATGVPRLSDVAAEHVLEPPASTSDLAGPPAIDEDWLVLSTAHSAKGLEWDAVHVLHASDGNFPSDMALTSPAGLEEERRLFYVAVTRPRRALHVYVPQRYHHHRRARDDPHSWSQPSRFLSEQVRGVMTERTTSPPEFDGPAPGDHEVLDAAARVAAQLDALWR